MTVQQTTKMYMVMKKFTDGGISRTSEEIIEDGSHLKWLSKLISQRYLKEAEIDSTFFRCQLCNRVFLNQDVLDTHYIEVHPDDIEIVDDSIIEEKGVKANEQVIKGKSGSGKTNTKRP